MPSLDTNCLLRWLLDDIPEQTELVTSLINSEESFAVSDVALIETVFVREHTAFDIRPEIGKSTFRCKINFIIASPTVH